MRDYRELLIWQKAHELTLLVYQATAVFPGDERFGLVSQMRRVSASIAINIAEGSGRETPKDFAHFIQMAIGSCSELKYELLLSNDLGYISQETYDDLSFRASEALRMMVAYNEKIRQNFLKNETVN